MLVIALTGPHGSGKSEALWELYDELEGQYPLEGLSYVSDGKYKVLFSGARVDAAASKGQLRENVVLLIVDRLTSEEHDVGLWDTIVATNPRTVIVEVPENEVANLDQRLRFHRILSSERPDFADQLREMVRLRKDWQDVVLAGLCTGTLLVGVNLFLRGSGIPFVGLIAGAMQVGVLTFASKSLSQRSRLLWVSILAAAVLSLAPGRFRLVSMFSASIQGLLYCLGIRYGGWNRVGAFLGSALAGAWAGGQGFFIQYLLFGRGVGRDYTLVGNWLYTTFKLTPLSQNLMLIVTLAYVTIMGLVGLVVYGKDSKPVDAEEFEDATDEPHLSRPARWHFGPPVILTLIEFGGMVWRDRSELAVNIIRLVGALMAVYVVTQNLGPERLFEWLRKRSLWGKSYAFEAKSRDGEN